MSVSKKAGKTSNYQKGLYAETLAGLLLRVKGYRILAKRYKTRHGEIDLITTRGNWLVFVEVKARAETAASLEAIVPKAQARIADAAQGFLAQNPEYAAHNIRFDVVTCAPNAFPVHHENMWP